MFRGEGTETMERDMTATELKMDAADLYREDTFTDRKVGSIRRLTPVNPDGSEDSKRRVLYVGQAQLLTPVGALPLTFEIDAGSLKEAVDNFSEAAKEAVDHAVEELSELRRQAASSIVVPEVGAAGFGGPGAIPGSGKIKVP
jgi:hypothetical protein